VISRGGGICWLWDTRVGKGLYVADNMDGRKILLSLGYQSKNAPSSEPATMRVVLEKVITALQFNCKRQLGE